MKSEETGADKKMGENEQMEVEDDFAKVEINNVKVKENEGKISGSAEKKSVRYGNENAANLRDVTKEEMKNKIMPKFRTLHSKPMEPMVKR